MPLELNVNMTSLHMIREELDSTLSQSATDFEAYLADQQDGQYLKSSRNAIAQIGGIFRLLEFPGAALLADEMAVMLDHLGNPDTKSSHAMINAVTNAFFILPRYLEYIDVKKKGMPILLIPYINDMRVARRDVLVAEYHFFNEEITCLAMPIDTGTSLKLEALASHAKRLNHMYQTGLVGVVKDPRNILHYQYMSRAVGRITALTGNHSSAGFWQLAHAVLECFAADKVELTINRKRNLASLEKMIRLIATKGEEGLNTEAPTELKKDFVFILKLADFNSEFVNSVREAYSATRIDTSDSDIVAQREIMHGPMADTIESVTKALKEELRLAKDILEIAAQNSAIEEEDANGLIDVVSRICDTLLILNLQGPRQILHDQLNVITPWQTSSDQLSRDEIIAVADAVLYVESAISSLDRNECTTDDLNAADASMREKIVASNQLSEAENLVIEEAQSGIALAKRAITAYAESNFDPAHIANVTVTLSTVRGGLHMINYSRAAAILKSCGDFVASNIDQQESPEQRHQLLETLADALISLEYYLYEVATNHSANEKILDVAEQSLAALGFEVTAVAEEA